MIAARPAARERPPGDRGSGPRTRLSRPGRRPGKMPTATALRSLPVTQDDAFLADILADPDDDGVRLIYADYLDERGDPRGEFIRVEVSMAGLPQGDPRQGQLR